MSIPNIPMPHTHAYTQVQYYETKIGQCIIILPHSGNFIKSVGPQSHSNG